MSDENPVLLRIVICSQFRKELEAVLAGDRCPGVVASVLPAFCAHPLDGHPQDRVIEWQRSAMATTENEPTVLILGGCCLGDPSDLKVATGSKILRLGQCLYLVGGESLIRHLLATGAYIVTPTWLQSWRDTIDRWGFDQSTARDFFREGASRVVLLDTGVEENSEALLREFAAWLDFPSEILPVGLDHFRLMVEGEIMAARKDGLERELQTMKRQLSQKEADSLMMLDLLESLVNKKSEKDVINGFFDLLSMLFAASILVFVPNDDLGTGTIVHQQLLDAKKLVPEITDWMRATNQLWKLSDDEATFFIRIMHNDTVFGVIAASGFEFPQYVKRYFVRAKSISRLCGMIIENLRLLKRVERIASVDGLTGLWNRRHFYETGLREMARANRYGTALTAVMFDLDFFKSVNDTYGHAAGDLVLKTVSACARGQMREMDVCGRIGGEEFAILLPETRVDQAFVFAERLRHAIEDLQVLREGKRIPVTISAGISQAYPIGVTDEMSFDILLSHCDEALYTAKKKGRNRCELYRCPSEKSIS